MTTIFISYRHVSQRDSRHKELVGEFAFRLRDAGVQVVLDQFLPQPPDPADPDGGWDRWSEDQVTLVESASSPPGAASKIIVVATVEWIAAYNKDPNDDPARGLGSACEAVGIRRILYRCKGVMERAPVAVATFGPWEKSELPSLLGELPRFDINDRSQFAALVSWIDASLPPLPPEKPWPAMPPVLEPWELALGGEARSACANMLTTETRQRVLRLLLSGKPDERKIAWMLFQCVANLEGRPGMEIRVGRLDLKGGTELGLELQEFARSLGCNEMILGHSGKSELSLLSLIFDRLERQQVPTLLIFDSIERGGNFREWVQRIALPQVPKVEWLRIVTSGEEAPEPEGAPWGQYAASPLRVGGAEATESAAQVMQRVEAAFAGKSPADRIALRSAFLAMAVPHWCDPNLLSTLLHENLRPRATELFSELRQLPGVESFIARGDDAVNLSGRTRATLRRHLAHEEPELLKTLSARAAAFFAGDESRTIRMERVYHRLVAQGNAAADDAESLDMEFWQGFGAAEHAIYAATLRELADEGSLHGRALLEALLSAGFSANKQARFEEARGLARRARETAQSGAALAMDDESRALYLWGMGRTDCIDGEIEWEKPDLAVAKASYLRFAALMEEACALAPGHVRLRQQHAVAESRVGICCEPEEALRHFEKSRALQESVVAAKPDDESELRELSVMDSLKASALMKLGQREGALDEALRLLEGHVASCRSRVAKDPTNLHWLSDLTDALRGLGDTQTLAARTGDALRSFRESWSAAQRRVELDPLSSLGSGQASDAHDPAVLLDSAEGRLINALLPSAEFGEAEQLCRQHLARCQARAAAAPGNRNTQFALGVAHYYYGELHRCMGATASALAWYRKAQRCYEDLLRLSQDLTWRRELSRVQGCIGGCLNDLGLREEARQSYRDQLDLCETLDRQAPGDYSTQARAVWAHVALGGFAAAAGKFDDAGQSYQTALDLARKLAVDKFNADAQRTLAQTLISVGAFWAGNEETESVYALGVASEACKIYQSLVDQAPTDAGRLAELAAAHLQIAAILEKKPEQIPLAAHHRKTAAGLFERQLEALRPTGLDTFPAICAGEQLAVLAARDPSVPRAQAVARALDLFRDLLARTEAYCAREENQSLEGPRRKLGDLHGAIATLLMETGALDEAGEHLRLALACWERFQRRQPDHIEWRLHAANTHARLADVAVARQDFGEADREFGTAIQGLEECWRLAPSNPFARQSLVTARYRRAHLLALTDRAAEALEELENCREHLDYVETLPDQGDLIQRHLIELERLTGTVLSRLGRNEEAIDAYSRALDRAGRLNGKTGGTDEALRAQTSETEGWLGIACISADKLGEAAVFLNHRRDFCEDQLRRDPGNALWRYGLGSALANLSIVQARSGDDTAAAALHREAITVLEPLTSQSPPFQLALRDLANEHNALAIHLHQHHDRAGAIRHGSRAIEVMETLIASAPGFPVYASHLQTFRTNLEIYSAA